MLDQHVGGLQDRRRQFLQAVGRRRQPRRSQVSLAGIEGSRDLLRRNDQVFNADAEFLGEGFDPIVFQAEEAPWSSR